MLFSRRSRISISIVVMLSFIIYTNHILQAKIQQPVFSTRSLTDSSPIFINSNDAFEVLGFSGNGSESNPFLIENLRVVSTGQLGSAIVISNTDVYFIIQNCEITTQYIGIYIQPTVLPGTAKIINNTVTCDTISGGGIAIGTDETLIENNTISGFMQGIHVNEANNEIIKGNSVLLSYYQGINIRHSSFNTIINNDIRNSNQHGLAIVGSTSTYNIIYNNIFVNNSNLPIYEIDGVITGDTNSQGYDGGSNNQWYDDVNQKGNSWDDYENNGPYNIDGSADAVDQYPLRYITGTTESMFLPLFSILVFICSIAEIVKRRR